jgi:hypothetical protein
MRYKNKPPKFQHLVPKVYQLQWSFNNSESIYAFYKNENYSRGKIKNAGNFLGVNDINSIKIENYNFLSDEGIDKLFRCLCGKIINGEPVNNKPSTVLKFLNITPIDFINNIHEYSITEANGFLLNKARKNDLSNQIRTTKFTDIEEFFANDIDNSWSDILALVRAIVCKPGIVQPALEKNKLVKYLLCQFIRNPVIPTEIDETLNNLLEIGPFNEIMQHIPDAIRKFKDYYRIIKSIEFMEQQPELKSTAISKYYKIFNCMTYTFLTAPSECSFITSDNPITFFTKVQNLSKGVYFPITPRIMLYMVRLKDMGVYDEKYYVEKISLATTKYINDIILKKAKQIVISNQEYLENLINGKYIQNEWVMITDKSRYFR